MARVLSPLTDRNIAQLIFLSIGLILINCILTNHLIFGLVSALLSLRAYGDDAFIPSRPERGPRE